MHCSLQGSRWPPSAAEFMGKKMRQVLGRQIRPALPRAPKYLGLGAGRGAVGNHDTKAWAPAFNDLSYGAKFNTHQTIRRHCRHVRRDMVPLHTL